jgi:hypothetical protein
MFPSENIVTLDYSLKSALMDKLDEMTVLDALFLWFETSGSRPLGKTPLSTTAP